MDNKYHPPKRAKGDKFSILQMSWWFDHQHFNHRENLEAFLRLLEKNLPEALPRRYGAYEPPPFKYEETGFDHLVDFLLAEKSIVAYTTKPVLGISLGLNETSGFVQQGTKRKYKSSYITLSLDADVLSQPDWQMHLPKIWTELSAAIQPFYGDVRVLKNYVSSKTTYYVDATTELHPVKAWWWKGIPQGARLAMVVGQPYRELYSGLAPVAEDKNGLLFLSADKWDDRIDHIGCVPDAPKDISDDGSGNLAVVFPFKEN